MTSIENKTDKIKKRIDVEKGIFLVSILAIPVICFAIFYVAVNFNSIIMAFQSYDEATSKFYFSGLVNFKEFFERISTTAELKYAFKNSAIVFALNVCVSMPLCMYISYCITEKIPFFIAQKTLFHGLGGQDARRGKLQPGNGGCRLHGRNPAFIIKEKYLKNTVDLKIY